MSKGEILIFETDEDYRRMLEIYFGGMGYSVQLVSSGQACLYAIESFEPDILLLSVDDLNCIDESTRQIIANCDANALPIIILFNTYGRIGIVDMVLGQPESVRKPFDIERLAVKISNAIETR